MKFISLLLSALLTFTMIGCGGGGGGSNSNVSNDSNDSGNTVVIVTPPVNQSANGLWFTISGSYIELYFYEGKVYGWERDGGDSSVAGHIVGTYMINDGDNISGTLSSYVVVDSIAGSSVSSFMGELPFSGTVSELSRMSITINGVDADLHLELASATDLYLTETTKGKLVGEYLLGDSIHVAINSDKSSYGTIGDCSYTGVFDAQEPFNLIVTSIEVTNCGASGSYSGYSILMPPTENLSAYHLRSVLASEDGLLMLKFDALKPLDKVIELSANTFTASSNDDSLSEVPVVGITTE
jgi:hypothetical protein